MRQRSRGHDGTATTQKPLSLEIRHLRVERGLSRDELARVTGYSRQYISQLEQPSRGIAAKPVIEAVDGALAAGGALVRLREAELAARSERLRNPPDPEVESRRRVHDLLDREIYGRKLDVLDRSVANLIKSAEQLSPNDITVRVQDQQRLADLLLRTQLLPHQQFHLFMLAGHLAGLQAIALFDSGELHKAGTCCLEAAVFTELADHDGLRAWILAVNCLIEAALNHERAGRANERVDQKDQVRNGYRGTVRVNDRRPDDTHAASATDGGGTARSESLSTAFKGLQEPPTTGLSSAAQADDSLIAPGGRSTRPILVALVKRRIARFAPFTAAPSERVQPPAGLSRSFQPPV